jgi:D-alanyl-D-alanine carboxypeptidase (penicillin-binding protein 5/6)
LANKDLFSSILLFLLICSTVLFSQEPKDPFPGLARSYLVKIFFCKEQKNIRFWQSQNKKGNSYTINDKTLWAHHPNRKLPPASLTKIMTALIALEEAGLNEVVTVSKRTAKETGTVIGLKAGDKIKVEDLLAACLIQSANDASYALAEYVGGSKSGFVVLMNARAKEMGLSNTHWTNPCGHDEKNHYSTANDLAILAETALKNPYFAEIVSFTRGRITTVDGRRAFNLENKNELIGRYPGAIGVKSGWTSKAGKCVIALAEREGTKVLLILLNAPNRWWDAEMLLDQAFKQ